MGRNYVQLKILRLLPKEKIMIAFTGRKKKHFLAKNIVFAKFKVCKKKPSASLESNELKLLNIDLVFSAPGSVARLIEGTSIRYFYFFLQQEQALNPLPLSHKTNWTAIKQFGKPWQKFSFRNSGKLNSPYLGMIYMLLK